MDNPWNIQSIYELQYFNCPSCVFKNSSKQELVDHAYEIHPESIDYLSKINDNSLSDVTCPWNEILIKIKQESNEHMEPDELNDPLNNEALFEVNTEQLDYNLTKVKPEIEATFNEIIVDKALYGEKSEQLDTDFTEINAGENFKSCSVGGIHKESDLDPSNLEIMDSKIEERKCQFCGKVFSSKGNLKEHLKHVHEGIKAYKCYVCHKTFSQNGNLKSHISSVHDGIHTHKCEMCKKTFSSKTGLKFHINKNHEGVKNPQSLYGKTFSQNVSLKSHINSHKCEKCGKIYNDPGYLKVHICKIFSKNHKCEMCEKNFGSFISLKNHTRIFHEGVKNQQSLLSSFPYDPLHPRGKNYKCEKCGKLYHDPGYRKVHICKNVSKNHKCDICGIVFGRRGSLTQHIRSIHNVVKIL